MCLHYSCQRKIIYFILLHEGVVKKKEKKIPPSRIGTSDLRITVTPIQSSALPAELSKEGISRLIKINSISKDLCSSTIEWNTLHCFSTHQFFNCWFWHWFRESQTTPCVGWCSHFVYDNLLLHGWWSRRWDHSYWWIQLGYLKDKGGKFLKKLWCCVGGNITR